MKINVYTTISRNSADYANFLWKSMYKLDSTKNEIRYYCVKSVNTDEVPCAWTMVGKIDQDYGHNSLNHGKALNVIAESANYYGKDTIKIIVDSDMCILMKDWDKVVIDRLTHFDAWGASRPNETIPSVMFLCWTKTLDFIDFCPKLHRDNCDNITKESPVRENCMKCDTGYQIREMFDCKLGMTFIPNDDKHIQLSMIPPKDRKLYSIKNTHMSEWWYKNKVFCSHKQASRNHAFDSPIGQYWAKRCSTYTEKEYGIKLL